jgi:Tfp pilus assembly PilM family ATPase/Tfp pilus assembly protein PilN
MARTGSNRVRGHEFISAQIGNDLLKLAYVKASAHRKEIAGLSVRNVAGLSDEEIAKLTKASLGEFKTKRPVIIDVIPSHSAITKNIEIPSTNPQEIREIINLQASRHTPYSREEIIIDHIDLGSYKRSYTKVLLIIVTRTVIKRHFEIFAKAGYKIDNVVLMSEGLARLVSRLARVEREETPSVILYIDGNTTDFSVALKSKALFIRSIPVGVQHLAVQEDKYTAKFIDEIKRSLESYMSENIEKAPAKLILSGAVGELKALESSLSDALHLETVTLSYLENLHLSGKALTASQSAKRLSFLDVIAAPLVCTELVIDLIPEETKLRRALEQRGRDLVTMGVLVLTAFILIFSAFGSKIYFKDTYLKRLTGKYESLNTEARKLEDDFERMSRIRTYLSGRGLSLEVLAELYDIIPFDLELTYVRYDSVGTFSLRGTAGSMATVFTFVGNMEKSKYFDEVKARHTTKRKDGQKDVTDFEIVCVLSKDGKEKE